MLEIAPRELVALVARNLLQRRHFDDLRYGARSVRTVEYKLLEFAAPELTAAALACGNAMSLFALNRRLRGAAAGHFAAFEATSSLPSRKMVAALQRLGFDAAVARYFDEHVESDAVHEQVALRDLCRNVVSVWPDLHEDVLMGAASALHLEAALGEELLRTWESEELVHMEPVAG